MPRQYESILLIGAGGVGAPLAVHLGNVTKRLSLVDHDIYEDHNIHRQPLAKGRIGQPKVYCLEEALKPWTSAQIVSFHEKFDDDSRERILKESTPGLIVVAVDNDAARKAIWPLNKDYDILWAANEIWSPQAGFSLKENPWNPMECFQPAEEAQGLQCGKQTVMANCAASALGTLMLMQLLVDEEDEKKLPVFISKTSGFPLQTIPREDL